MSGGPVEPVAERQDSDVFGSVTSGAELELSSGAHGDSRAALSYLIHGEVEDYISIMDVLESSVTELTPAEVARAVGGAGRPLGQEVVEDRLDRLRQWGAVHATTDTSRILRYSDMLARNWRYTATAVGRQVHRFYRTVLAGTPTVREIPLASLNRIVRTLDALRDGTVGSVADAVSEVFVNHDDLDGALVGAEDALAVLADRYDLDSDAAAELRGLLVDYATRVAAELEDGSTVAFHLLKVLRPRFQLLAQASVESSEARTLIERGALTASKGGRIEDWEGLAAWFDPATGRAARFSMRLVRALPGMHTNLRRLHTSSGVATGRKRALRLAAACSHTELGPAIAAAALGDHPWRKLHGQAEDDDLTRTPSWAAGPQAPVPEMVALSGRGGARGRAPAARDDSNARAVVETIRANRAAQRQRAVAEVLAAPRGVRLSEAAGAVALEVLLAAARRAPTRGSRTAVADGLACTIFRSSSDVSKAAAAGPRWTVWTPGRLAVFHAAGTAAACDDVVEDSDRMATVSLGSVA